ncbi:group II truncated hemoglobin [Streptomyces fimbriatus]
MATMFEHVGGEATLRKMAEHFHEAVLGDELLGKLFRYGSSHHVDHLTAFLAEMLGGPRRYSEELGGFESIYRAHQGLGISDEQRDRFVELMLESADAVGLPADERFRTAFTRQIARAAGFSTRVSRGELDHFSAPYPELVAWEW